ncbi:unnamed protein product [Heligmosomoides polygyrus]|uniref:Dynein light chain n=1 Tax=Heligmosomoides polygyrus TaxID=6339 RepID=A0A3P7ZPR2_HELPZ|nr:unnamed protein product [Heligmosomoides polygyrus]
MGSSAEQDVLKTSSNVRRDSEDVLRTASNVRRDSEDVQKTSFNVRRDLEDVLKMSFNEACADVKRSEDGKKRPRPSGAAAAQHLATFAYMDHCDGAPGLIRFPVL